MEWEGCECPKCSYRREERAEWPSPSPPPSPPLSLASRSGSSKVGGDDSGDSCREVSRDGASEEFVASGRKRKASEGWDAWDGKAPSSSTPIQRPSAVASALVGWGRDRKAPDGVSEAFLASGRKASVGWDAWADKAPSSSTAIPGPSAVASAPVGWGGSTSDSMSIPPSSPLADVTVADGGRAFDCSACCLPLKPPIFQCDRGHPVCHPCLNTHLSWEGSGAAARCNASGGHDTDGFRRCQPLERAVESIQVLCPNARCHARLPRHCLLTHRRSCIYAPTASCPRDACRFAGSAEALLDHFISVEKWPYTAEKHAGKSFDIRLWGGFNVLGVVRGITQHLLVLYVAQRPFGSTLSAMCICPQPDIILASPETLKCKLELHYPATHDPQTSEYQVRTSFDVPCTDPFDGFPSPDDLFQFFVPNSVHSDCNAAIGVTASVTIFE